MMTHENPDVDGLGSMLALEKSLTDLGKEVVILIPKSLTPPLSLLSGAERMIVHGAEFKQEFDAVLALDCAEKERLGPCVRFVAGEGPLHKYRSPRNQHSFWRVQPGRCGQLLHRGVGVSID